MALAQPKWPQLLNQRCAGVVLVDMVGRQKQLYPAQAQPASCSLPRLVAYERVSTARQRASGLGLESQRNAIVGFVARSGAAVLAHITEVKSGKRSDRPELIKVLHLAKVTGALW